MSKINFDIHKNFINNFKSGLETKNHKIEKYTSDNEYILWLMFFLKKYGESFTDRGDVCASSFVSDNDKKYISDLGYFYEGICSYAKANFIKSYFCDNKKFYKIQYHGFGYEVGTLLNGDIQYFCRKVPVENENEFIDFYDIISNKKRDNVEDVYDSLNKIKDAVNSAYEKDIPVEFIVNAVNNAIIAVKYKEERKNKEKTLVRK